MNTQTQLFFIVASATPNNIIKAEVFPTPELADAQASLNNYRWPRDLPWVVIEAELPVSVMEAQAVAA